MLKNYLKTAYLVYLRRKAFTAINLVCIVLTLVVLMVTTALLENTFHPSGVEGKSDRFLQIWMMQTKTSNDNTWGSPLGYKLIDHYLKPLKSTELVAAVSNPEPVSVYQKDRVTKLDMRLADANYWKVLDFTLLAGRLPTLDDDQRGRTVMVVNQSSALRLFGVGQAVGQKLNVGSQVFEVIGVVQDELHFNAYADLWAPITSKPNTDYQNEMNGEFTALLLGRSPDDLDAIRREVAQVAKTITYQDERQGGVTSIWADSKLDAFARILTHNNDHADSGSATVLAVVGSCMVLFMLLPALNLVNLNMGRTLERSSEIGVRKAFGATSAQLVGQLMLENLLLCLAGGVISLLCTTGVLLWLESSGLIPYLRLHLNWTVYGAGLVLTLVFGVLSGVIPAWKMSRMDPVVALKGVA